jgi:chemotaxis protein MotB
VNHERWLVSYADFITLMFAFFVVLYASSQADKKKQAQVSQSINQAFKALGLFQPATTISKKIGMASSTDNDASPVNIVLGDELAASPEVKKDLTRIQHELSGKLSNQIAKHVVAMRLGHDGLVISLREAGFYDSGSATPHPSSMPSIDAIASSLGVVPYDIRIEGHTDNVPIHTGQFDSNWELSSSRATKMAEIFIERHHFLPGRLSAAGYAEFHPVASNGTPEGRGQNRRVDIIVLSRISFPAGPQQPLDASDEEEKNNLTK